MDTLTFDDVEFKLKPCGRMVKKAVVYTCMGGVVGHLMLKRDNHMMVRGGSRCHSTPDSDLYSQECYETFDVSVWGSQWQPITHKLSDESHDGYLWYQTREKINKLIHKIQTSDIWY